MQAQRLVKALGSIRDLEVEYLVVDPVLPSPFAALQRIPVLRTLARSIAYIHTLLRRVPYADTVHVFSASYWSFLLAPVPAMAIGRIFGKRVLLNYHSGEADDHLTRWGWHAKPLIRLADAIVVPTQYLVDVFARHGLQAIAIANHVDADSMIRRERKFIVPVYFSNRNFETHYNVSAVLRAFAIVQKALPAAQLVVAGDGSLRVALEQEAAALDLRGVRFTGPVRPADMPALYAAADVYVNASLIDNMPLSLLEAYASELPVVTSDAGGIPWIAADGETALVVPKGDVAALANAMLAVVEDPGAAAERTRRAREFVVADFSWAAVSSAWVKEYAGAIPSGASEISRRA